MGGPKDAATTTYSAFMAAYLANGHNAAQAAISADYSKRSAHVTGARLLKKAKSSGDLASLAERAAEACELTTERTLQEFGRVAFVDPRRLFNADGSLKEVHEFDDDTAAAIASIEIRPDGTKKIKLWDKNAALDELARHFGLFEKDSAQVQNDIRVEVVLVQPKG